MIGLVLLLVLAIGVPVFAVVAMAVLTGFLQAELEPALLIISVLELGDQVQLLAVPLMSFVAAILGRDYYLNSWILPISSMAGENSGLNPSSIAVRLLSALASGCAVGLTMVIPAVLYTAISEVAAPRHSVSAEVLLVTALIPVALVAVAAACMPGLGGRARSVFGSVSVAAERTGRPLWDLGAAILLLVAVVAGWLALLDVALVAAIWAAVTRVLVFHELSWQQLTDKAVRAAVTSAGVLLVVGLSLAWAAILHDAGTLQALSDGIGRGTGQTLAFLLVASLLLVAGGFVFGLQIGVVLIAPLIVPVGLSLGVDALGLGVMCLVGVLLGRGSLALVRAPLPEGGGPTS